MAEQIHSKLEILAERFIFNNRFWMVLLFLLITLFLGYQATSVTIDTDLEKMIPQSHSYVQNARKLLGDEGDAGSGNLIRIAVAVKDGDIFDPQYLDALRKISDELSLLPGVDTGGVLSLWEPGLQWFAVTAEGFDGGPIIDSYYDGSSESLRQVEENIFKSEYLGSYIANDFKSSMISLPILATNPKTGEPLNFTVLSHALETVREKFQSDNLSIHMIGDVKKFADLVDGFVQVGMFFAFAFVITGILLYYYSRCWKATVMPLFCSVIAVVWQLGLLNLLGYGVGVFSVLVPFLVFAIGISHGVQIINSIAHESSKGESRLDAARITFQHLVKPGMLALLSDGIGFATLLVINIGVIQDLAVAASLGVAIIILTNLILLPVLMSYIGVTQGCIKHSQYKRNEKSGLWETLSYVTNPKAAAISLLIALLGAGVGLYFSKDLKIGDLDKGAPELRADSRYNLDSNYITSNFSTSTDEMLIFVEAQDIFSYKVNDLTNRFEWVLQNTKGVQSVESNASSMKWTRFAYNEGNFKFFDLARAKDTITYYLSSAPGGATIGEGGGASTIRLELADHKEETLQSVVLAVEKFAAENNDNDITFSLGYGNGAFEAATNQVVGSAQNLMLLCVYGVVSLLCLLTFRSWRAVLCIMLPLALTSILCQALMAQLGIGIKVGTLPVIALGVGIGVDYGIYIYTRLESYLSLGHSLREAYLETLLTTGKAVCFTGLTLAIGVGTWIFSPIKFQADMGILLTFMFLWNMVGALWLLPALARFLVKKPVQTEDVGMKVEAIS